jgi:hypothetical protein
MQDRAIKQDCEDLDAEVGCFDMLVREQLGAGSLHGYPAVFQYISPVGNGLVSA